ncbi:MAG TPA: hypothetical protein VEJ63_11180 [Planctomycetota bacterium]|nr:hypothetical protein [Planctomycetota bacterium]
MTISEQVHCLLDDWQSRLERAAASDTPSGAEQSRVLQFLIRRYGNTEIARQPAIFPVRREVYLNTRAILVHHAVHGDNPNSGLIVGRISGRNPQDSVGAPSHGAVLPGAFDIKGSDRVGAYPFVPYPFEHVIRWARGISRTDWMLARVEASLKEKTLLREDVVKFLAKHLHSQKAAELMAKCENASVVPWAVDAWRQQPGGAALDQIFNAPHHRAAALQMFREELANPNPEIRLRAIEKVEQMGNLHDVGLLLDLINLPAQPGDLPQERERLMQAVKALSGDGHPDV